MSYKKCNPETNYGWNELIFEAMTALGGPAKSNEIWSYAVAEGMVNKLWVVGQDRPKTHRSTFYGRINDAYRRTSGFADRITMDGEMFYELIPGRTPRSAAHKLDYSRRDCHVYRVIDPATRVPLYIGMGRGGRKDVHLTGGSHSADLNAAISAMRALGREPQVEIVKKGLRRTEALRLEATLIATYGRRRYDLTGVLFNTVRSQCAA